MDEAHREPWLRVVVAGVVLAAAMYLLDAAYFAILLLGPLVTGAVAGARGSVLRWPVATWVVAGVALLLYDAAANREDVAFHVATTVVTALLAATAWRLAVALRRRRAATA